MANKFSKKIEKVGRWITVSKKKPIWIIVGLILLISGYIYTFKPNKDISKIKSTETEILGLQSSAYDAIMGVTDTVNNLVGIDCKNLEDSDWVNDGNMKMEKQFLFLKGNQQVGSIRLSKQFSDLFILKFTFIPVAIKGINITISVKDNKNNELGITIGDSNYEQYRVTIRKNGEVTEDKAYQLNGPAISRDQEVYFQLETLQRADSVFANAFINYNIKNKPNSIKPFHADLLLSEIPSFSENMVRLNIGLRESNQEKNPKIRMVDCKLEEKN